MADGARDLTDFTGASKALVRTEGAEQFILLPDAFRIDAEEVWLRREGNSVILQPAEPASIPKSEAEWEDHWAEIDRLRGDDRLALGDDEVVDGLE